MLSDRVGTFDTNQGHISLNRIKGTKFFDPTTAKDETE